MTAALLRDRPIAVIEDEYLLADELCAELIDAGAIVLGPAGTIEEAEALVRSAPTIAGAVLDVNLRGEWTFPVADVLNQRNVPFVFATGYDARIIPPRFASIRRCEKPIAIAHLLRALAAVIAP